MSRSSEQVMLMTKAETACSSAWVLLRMSDSDGAVNRAYYAIFASARVALLGSEVATETEVSRTHSRLIGAFGQYLVKPGVVSKELGRLLNRAYEMRQIADYKGESITLEDATLLVEQAEMFVTSIRNQFVHSAS